MRLNSYLNEAIIKTSFGPKISNKLNDLEDDIYELMNNPLKVLNDYFNSEDIFFEQTNKVELSKTSSIQGRIYNKSRKDCYFFQ